jgi:outer membrane protein assembly factor BamD
MQHAGKLLAIVVMLAMVLGSLSGCGRGRAYEDLPMDAAWAKIMDYYERERYLDAIDYLELFLINYSGSALADSAQFLLAESHFSLKEYLISASEYQKVVTQYPQSNLAAEAEFMMGESYFLLAPKYSLDQTYTESAIEAFQLFIEDFPDSELVEKATKRIEEARDKLAHKQYANGRLYHRMGELPSARLYYNLVIENYYDTRYAGLAQYYKATSYEKSKQWRDAVREYSNFLQKFPEHEFAQRALDDLNYAREQLLDEQRQQAKERETEAADG